MLSSLRYSDEMLCRATSREALDPRPKEAEAAALKPFWGRRGFGIEACSGVAATWS
jgi:hypothetical protein